MINFIEGKVDIREKNILAASDVELGRLADEGLIEKRRDTLGTYYYVEEEADGKNFSVTVSSREKNIQQLRLHRLDSLMKTWDDVSVEGVKHEYHMLSNLVKKLVGRPPDIKTIANMLGNLIGDKFA
ncbi:hypothetical protein LE190_18160 [Massilia oculi]|uniref:Uncharacterized protein n=1 Tax=Massilia hydrophila TaxID=3044279 RepID=A0ABS7YDP7_9BURK|nr:hypothetical protein [Massilia oculi]MCA1857834.1 hypothetical protein [Massilia oculi]